MMFLVASAGLVGLVAFRRRRQLRSLAGRAKTALKAFASVYTMPKEKVDRFMNSYSLFQNEAVTKGTAPKISDYYGVLNQLCSMGEIEKMYIPPVVDPDAGLAANQELFERKMALEDLQLRAGDRVLDVGCGRGRIAAHVASLADGVHVSGINIEPTQIENARANASRLGFEKRLDFTRGDYNDPLPFGDSTFDAAYNVQALSYIRDGDFGPLFRELFRVLRPGARFSTLDWVRLPKFDESNPEHRELLSRCKGLIGAVYTPTAEQFERSLREAGFEVTYSGIPSVDGLQYTLVLKAVSFFQFVRHVVNALTAVHLLPRHLKDLMDRFNKDGDTLVQGDRERLWTTVYQVVARKPVHVAH